MCFGSGFPLAFPKDGNAAKHISKYFANVTQQHRDKLVAFRELNQNLLGVSGNPFCPVVPSPVAEAGLEPQGQCQAVAMARGEVRWLFAGAGPG